MFITRISPFATSRPIKAVGINYGYIGKKTGGGKVRPHLVMEFLKHHDARVRRVMFGALLSQGSAVTPEVYELAVKAMKDPERILVGQGRRDSTHRPWLGGAESSPWSMTCFPI